jgi:peptide/nickel transport system permease protein
MKALPDVSKPTAIAGLILVALILGAFAAPWLAPYAPEAVDLSSRQIGPSFEHLFGTDALGRDVFSRTVFGARVSLSIGLLSAAVTGLLGVAIGAASGFSRGWIDSALMRLTDTMLSIPRLPLLMIVSVILEPSILFLILVVGLVGWMETARVVRAEVLSLRERSFAEAARSVGNSGAQVLIKHLLPNAAPAAAVAITLAVGRGILLESAMSFFGVGVQPPQASWGNMLYQAQSSMSTEPWVAIFPGLFIFITVFTVFQIGDAFTASKTPG